MRANPGSRATIAVLISLLPPGCGGRTGLDEGVLQSQAAGFPASSAGGRLSNGGTSGSGLGGSTLSNTNTGGMFPITSSVVGCPGQPVVRPPLRNGGRCGDCSGSQGQGPQTLGGIDVSVLEIFANSFASTCTYPAPACTPLIAFSDLGYADPNNLSVWLSFPDGTAEMYAGVLSAADCTTSLGGFYLDSINTMPTTITFCPCTCARLGSIQGTIYVIDFPIVCLD
jgi:hypothetical protein